MAGLALKAIQTTLRLLPMRPRERLAARLFRTPMRHPEPGREAALRERGEVMELGGMHGTAFGAADGPVVLMLHGWAGRGLQLGAYVDPLVETGHRAIAVDFPGHGRTGKGATSLPAWVHALEAAVAETRPVALVTHSFGALAALLMAERTGYKGRILCLGGPPETFFAMRDGRRMLGLGDDGFEVFKEELSKAVGAEVDDYDVLAKAAEVHATVVAILAAEDEDIPAAVSREVVEKVGGAVHELPDVTHRSVMWDEQAMRIGLGFLLDD